MSSVVVAAPTDHELMLAVRGGDLARLGELFERRHRELYGFFVRLTGDRAVSEDLVQIVFQRLLKYRASYRDDGNFAAWFYQIARKTAYRWRAQTRPPPGSADDDQDPAAAWVDPVERVPDHGPHAADRAATSDDVALLHRALAALAPEQRDVLVLARFQHLKHEEIAEMFQISPGAVKARAHRALHELREVFFKLCRHGHA